MKRPEQRKPEDSGMRAPLRVVGGQSAPHRAPDNRPRPLGPEGGRGRWRSRRDLVADRVALGPVEDAGLDHIVCAHRLKSQMVDRWRRFVREQFPNINQVALEYEVSPQGAANWWHGLGGPSAAALAQAALTRHDAFLRHFGGCL